MIGTYNTQQLRKFLEPIYERLRQEFRVEPFDLMNWFWSKYFNGNTSVGTVQEALTEYIKQLAAASIDTTGGSVQQEKPFVVSHTHVLSANGNFCQHCRKLYALWKDYSDEPCPYMVGYMEGYKEGSKQ